VGQWALARERALRYVLRDAARARCAARTPGRPGPQVGPVPRCRSAGGPRGDLQADGWGLQLPRPDDVPDPRHGRACGWATCAGRPRRARPASGDAGRGARGPDRLRGATRDGVERRRAAGAAGSHRAGARGTRATDARGPLAHGGAPRGRLDGRGPGSPAARIRRVLRERRGAAGCGVRHDPRPPTAGAMVRSLPASGRTRARSRGRARRRPVGGPARDGRDRSCGVRSCRGALRCRRRFRRRSRGLFPRCGVARRRRANSDVAADHRAVGAGSAGAAAQIGGIPAGPCAGGLPCARGSRSGPAPSLCRRLSRPFGAAAVRAAGRRLDEARAVGGDRWAAGRGGFVALPARRGDVGAVRDEPRRCLAGAAGARRGIRPGSGDLGLPSAVRRGRGAGALARRAGAAWPLDSRPLQRPDALLSRGAAIAARSRRVRALPDRGRPAAR